MKQFIYAANWKMNKNPRDVREFFDELKTSLRTGWPKDADSFIFFASSILLTTLCEEVQKVGVGSIHWGAQNTHFEESGAFTGETSPLVVAQLGAHHTLVGHSERRALFCEDNTLLAKKVAALQKLNISPMLCVGETLEEREKGQTESVIASQLIAGLSAADFHRPFTIAYEPVWAIGTGKVANPEQAQNAHGFLRKTLEELGPQLKKTPILYGGSVKADNAQALKVQPDIDGFLIGGASLEVKSLLAIAKS